MERDTKILLAGSIGVLIGLGLFGIKRFLSERNKQYQDYYADFHRHFDKTHKKDDHHGVEFLAML
ncbi:hypothetical protein [Chryseobacterium sp.]|uniref:hypothetical protein n=1 Tax=Chryseobacterium sp. TaxID=1871047 RepID=UPI0011CB341B|nr:hypothetical protein [Chryseobacterium sp.]TXF75953.1 hypothetical protein FUA25_08605 [Chryseobacterium sp.]